MGVTVSATSFMVNGTGNTGVHFSAQFSHMTVGLHYYSKKIVLIIIDYHYVSRSFNDFCEKNVLNTLSHRHNIAFTLMWRTIPVNV